MSKDLKPCPFCGGPAQHPQEDMMPPRKHKAECPLCAFTEVFTEDWNRRPVEDRLAAENARLTKELVEAREAIRQAPLMVDVTGVPLHKDGLAWIKLPAVRAALREKA